MAAMVLFGVPPEEYWRYVIADFDKEPSAFCYAFAQNYQAIQYFRLDPPNIPEEMLLKRIKTFLAAGLPSMFGFTVFSSIRQAGDDGKIPFPCRREDVLGGHAVVAVGYDDKIKIENTICEEETKGALIIRNSWGTGWGDGGYGYLPYDYILRGLAIDWWTLLRNEWVDTGVFYKGSATYIEHCHRSLKEGGTSPPLFPACLIRVLFRAELMYSVYMHSVFDSHSQAPLKYIPCLQSGTFHSPLPSFLPLSPG